MPWLWASHGLTEVEVLANVNELQTLEEANTLSSKRNLLAAFPEEVAEPVALQRPEAALVAQELASSSAGPAPMPVPRPVFTGEGVDWLAMKWVKEGFVHGYKIFLGDCAAEISDATIRQW